jgi:hypothetical protein
MALLKLVAATAHLVLAVAWHLGSEVSGTLPIGNGGTGATTAANARLALQTSQASTGIAASCGGQTTCLNSIYSRDSRAVNDAPQDRDAGLFVDFKQNATNGLSDGGTYNGVLTFRPYGSSTDFSGGQTSQLAVTDNGNLWMRTSTNSTTWGTWYQMCSTKAVCSGYAPATGGSGYVQLQGTTPGTQQTGNFNISGAGILGGNLTIGGSTTASGAITVKTSTNVQLGLDTNGATQASITFSNAGASKWQVGNQNSGNYNFFIWDTVGGTNVLDAAGNNGTITLGAASRALTLGGNTISVAGNTTVTGSNTFTVGTGATTLGGSLSVASNTILGGQTANGISHFQWDGATYRNPGDFTPSLMVRQDNSATGTNGFKPALTLYNNDGSQNSTVGLAFVSREENGAGNAVDLAGHHGN